MRIGGPQEDVFEWEKAICGGLRHCERSAAISCPKTTVKKPFYSCVPSRDSGSPVHYPLTSSFPHSTPYTPVKNPQPSFAPSDSLILLFNPYSYLLRRSLTLLPLLLFKFVLCSSPSYPQKSRQHPPTASFTFLPEFL